VMSPDGTTSADELPSLRNPVCERNRGSVILRICSRKCRRDERSGRVARPMRVLHGSPQHLKDGRVGDILGGPDVGHDREQGRDVQGGKVLHGPDLGNGAKNVRLRWAFGDQRPRPDAEAGPRVWQRPQAHLELSLRTQGGQPPGGSWGPSPGGGVGPRPMGSRRCRRPRCKGG